MKVFIDTSAFIALFEPKDQYHGEALVKQRIIQQEKLLIFTSNIVLYETLTWIAIKLGADQATQFGEGILRQSPLLYVFYLARVDELTSLKILQKYQNLPLSFADASTIHLMHQYKIDKVFTFDEHFKKANLQIF